MLKLLLLVERDCRKCLVGIGVQFVSYIVLGLLVSLQWNLRSFLKIPQIAWLVLHKLKLNQTNKESVFRSSFDYKVKQK